jgi:hypothetical protein
MAPATQRAATGSNAWRRVKYVTFTPTLSINSMSRRVAVHEHPVIFSELGKQGVPCFADVERVLNESVRVHIGLADLALGPVVRSPALPREPAVKRCAARASATQAPC